MGADASQLPAGYPTDGTQGHPRSSGAYAYGAFTLYGAAFQRTSASPPGLLRGPYNTTSPEPFGPGFSLPCAAFGRPYSRHRFCFLFLRVLRCFNSPRSPSRLGVRQKPREVPFGNPRFDGCLRLAGAYRSLPRPSSAPRAEPSTRRLSCHRAGRFLDQLAYARPSSWPLFGASGPSTPSRARDVHLFVVDRPGFEPGASGLQSRRSPRLSYRPTLAGPAPLKPPRTGFRR